MKNQIIMESRSGANVPNSSECFTRCEVRVPWGEEEFTGSQVSRMVLVEETKVGKGQQ
jgi:hypothetical protein